MPKVRKIPATISRITGQPEGSVKKRRVAGYARVSTDNEEQQSSYEAQMDYYTKYITSRKDWEFVAMYSDEGTSATSTKHRSGFNHMIEDALAGHIDLIVTKSISRFARNTVDSLTTIRKLKEKGVEVYFEKENIHTLDAKGELLITIMSSLAQEESRSISENTTWGRRKAFADGKYSLAYSNFFGYDKGENGKLVINYEQAETVKLIYRLYLDGLSCTAIAQELTGRGIKSPMGKDKWSRTTVMYILGNEKHCGSALLQKKYTESFLTKKQLKNNGEVPQYLVDDDHDPIIEKRTWELVQEELSKRNGKGKRYSGCSIFSSKIVCGECGGYYGSKVWHSNDKYRRIVWRCNHKYEGGGKCETPHLTEDEIKEKFIRALKIVLDEKDEVIRNLQLLRETVSDTSVLEKQLEEAAEEVNILADMVHNVISENARYALDQDAYTERFNSLMGRYEAQKQKCQEIEERIATIRTNDKLMEGFIGTLADMDGAVTEFSDNLWGSLVDHITVFKDKSVTFTFKGGKETRV